MRVSSALAYLFCLVVLSLCLCNLDRAAEESNFGSDSWTYLELSKTVFSDDFYQANTFRSYQGEAGGDNYFSSSFPPLHPIIIACLNKMFDIGIYAGYFFNCFLLLVILGLCILISRTLFARSWIGVVISLLLLGNVYFRREVLGGLSIPFALCVQLGMLYLLLRWQRLSLSKACILGVLSGVSVLQRFDFLFAGIALGVSIGFLRRKVAFDWKMSAAYFVIFISCLSPWLIYSYTHFGVLFASDNSRVVLFAFENSISDYFLPGEKLDTILTAPGKWFLTYLQRLTQVIEGLWVTIIATPLILGISMFALLSWKLLRRGRLKRNAKKLLQDRYFLILLGWGVVSYGMMFLSISLTGYGRERYFTGVFVHLHWLLFYAIFCLYRQREPLIRYSLRKIKILKIHGHKAILCICVISSLYSFLLLFDTKIRLNPQNISPSEFKEILQIVNKDKGGIFFVSTNFSYQAKLGALTGLTIYQRPLNLGFSELERIQAFSKEYKPKYIFVDKNHPKRKEIIALPHLQQTKSNALFKLQAQQ